MFDPNIDSKNIRLSMIGCSKIYDKAFVINLDIFAKICILVTFDNIYDCGATQLPKRIMMKLRHVADLRPLNCWQISCCSSAECKAEAFDDP